MSWITDCALWDGIIVDVLTVTINQASGQADPDYSGGAVTFDIVFSEAVTGFVSGDVTVTGTAGATSGVVSGAGPTYLFTVTGMTGAGTVIASIAGGVCTATATGAPNDASTSTDNTVQWYPVYLDDFNRANSTNLGPNWTEIGTNLEIASNVLRSASSAGTQAVWNTAMPSTRHYVELTIANIVTDAYMIVGCTGATISGQSYYIGGWRGSVTDFQIQRVTAGGSFSTLNTSSSQSITNGDRIRVEKDVATIRVYKNGALMLTATDGVPLTAGSYVGVWLAGSNETADNFQAGALP